ncbi:RHS repeat domain-containing protein [Flavobacterium inviolabile]|uniref:RHS repeat domain-containing protein n=1 Tax=Flavobacterium inviolabile TaxID=2748320 RepID=UPI0015AB6DA4|nr:RHS repeat-associated core domain-containing protein [Flavobacterium inviolabile]
MKKMFWMLCLLSLHITAQTVGENGATDDYTYDASGNLILDANKNITNITYNHLNLPVVITFSNGDKIVYLYNAVGEKRQKKVTVGDKTTVTDYLGGFQYEDGELKFFQHEEGYVAVTNSDSGMDFTYVYNYTDHLGNVRLSWAKDNTTDALKIIRESHYYPYGLEHKGYNTQKYAFIVPENGISGIWTEQKKTIVNPYRYSYNGKEFQHELRLNLYDYGARNYDPAIGRWMNIDPLAEKSRRFSPYVYALDNPVYFIDPDGMQAISTSNIYDDRIQMTTAVGNDDWVKNGKNIFFDATISSQADATAAYGDSVKHLNDGSTLTGYKRGKASYQYTFHNNGTVTNMNNKTIDTSNDILTEGGTTIQSTGAKSGNFSGVSIGGAFLGGISFEAGFINDDIGGKAAYFTFGGNAGIGGGTGFKAGKITPTGDNPFSIIDFAGKGNSISTSFNTPLGGYGWERGGSQGSSFGNFGDNKRGYQYTAGSVGITPSLKVEAIISETKTWILPLK